MKELAYRASQFQKKVSPVQARFLMAEPGYGHGLIADVEAHEIFAHFEWTLIRLPRLGDDVGYSRSGRAQNGDVRIRGKFRMRAREDRASLTWCRVDRQDFLKLRLLLQSGRHGDHFVN